MSLAKGGASTIASSHPDSPAVLRTCPRRAGGIATTAGVSAALVSFQKAALAWGSRSKTAAERPLCSAATASAVASVVFPTPPFWEMTATVRMTIRRCSYTGVRVYTHKRCYDLLKPLPPPQGRPEYENHPVL